jgi:hypothetical protein
MNNNLKLNKSRKRNKNLNQTQENMQYEINQQLLKKQSIIKGLEEKNKGLQLFNTSLLQKNTELNKDIEKLIAHISKINNYSAQIEKELKNLILITTRGDDELKQLIHNTFNK